MKNTMLNDYFQPIDYLPSEDEEYLNERQLRYFEFKLLKQRRELQERIEKSIQKLKTLRAESSDLIDKSNFEYDIALELRAMERNSNLLYLSDKALKRIKDGSFGYCILTGQAIGLKRLDLIPTTSLSVDAMRMFERRN